MLNLRMGRPYASLDEPKEAVIKRWEQLMADGWADGGHEGMIGYVHVEHLMLEKIEGPMPDGPF